MFSTIFSKTIMNFIFFITFFHVIFFFLSLNIVFCIEIEIKDFHPQERDALLLIRDSLNSSINLHGNWTGPPCINNLSRWFGITCSNWHVVHILMHGLNLSGYLPSNFLQNITFLRQIDFSNNALFGTLPNLKGLVFLEHVKFSLNHFTGSIPKEYVELHSLKVLELQENYLNGEIPFFDQTSLISFNVSYNHLVGKIPENFVLQRFPKSCFDNNSELCGKILDKLCPYEPPSPFSAPPPFAIPPPSHKKRLQVWIIGLISIAAAFFLFLMIVGFLFCKRQGRGNETRRNNTTSKIYFIHVIFNSCLFVFLDNLLQ